MQRIANPSTPVRFRPQPHILVMLEIKVKDIDDAIDITCSLLRSYSQDKEELNICLTGGKFGEGFSMKLGFIINSSKKLNFLITDERFISATDKDSNQRAIKENLNSIIVHSNPNSNSNFIFFNTSKDYSSCFKLLRSELERENVSKPDFLVLSLGEDGHLAGHFHNSIFDSSNVFCYTDHAPKFPRKRVSFSMQWLLRSKKIILAAVGADKKYELKKFLDGRGLHSELLNHPNLTILS